MIKFFRKIRQNLLSEGKSEKYLKYAIGEIILVVVGILIALQINLKSQEKTNRNNIESILKKEGLYQQKFEKRKQLIFNWKENYP